MATDCIEHFEKMMHVQDKHIDIVVMGGNRLSLLWQNYSHENFQQKGMRRKDDDQSSSSQFMHFLYVWGF